jgi:hypothetical protein
MRYFIPTILMFKYSKMMLYFQWKIEENIFNFDLKEKRRTNAEIILKLVFKKAAIFSK